MAAVIHGNPDDLSVTLKQEEVTIPLGTKFDPFDYIEINDPSGNRSMVQVIEE